MTLEINIGKIRNVKGASQHFQLTVAELDFMDPNWKLAEPMVIALTLTNEGQFLSLNGTVETRVEGRCDRCLEQVIVPVQIEVTELLLYANDTTLFSHLAVGELEEKYYLYYNDTLDITEIIRESILAVLPVKVLCRDDCRGLCLKCGQNLNHGQCDCQTTEIDPRLAILAKLKVTEEV